jgi:hypothetical protein
LHLNFIDLAIGEALPHANGWCLYNLNHHSVKLAYYCIIS